MEPLYCYAFVEDAPSAAIVKRIVDHRNQSAAQELLFVGGLPTVMRGNGNLLKKCPAMFKMAKAGLFVICLTDLDTHACPGALIADWFSLKLGQAVVLPRTFLFRVAVREIESWIMADRQAWANYIGIAAANFSETPDELPDPKQHLLHLLRSKGKKKLHFEMLPRGKSHVGPKYNEALCSFVESNWSPERASQLSPSLDRALRAIQRL